MILDFFLNRAKEIKGGQKFRNPKKLEFLISILGRAEFTTSFLVKAEVIRELVCGQDISKDKVDIMWSELSGMLGWEYIERFCFGEILIDLIADFKIRLRTLMNYQHLLISVSKNLYFVTGDRGILESAKKSGNQKIMSYPELRKAFS